VTSGLSTRPIDPVGHFGKTQAMKRRWCWGLCGAIVSFCPVLAFAQVTSPPISRRILTGWHEATAVAYDPRHDVFLVVGAGREVEGMFIAPDGTPVTSPFRLGDPTPFGATDAPQVVYSPDVSSGSGGFLVAWTRFETLMPFSLRDTARARVVSFPGILGEETVIYDPALSPPSFAGFLFDGLALAYSARDRTFVLVLERSIDVVAVRVTNAGQPIGQVMRLGPRSVRSKLIWNPVSTEFGLVSARGIGWPETIVLTRFTAGGTILGETPVLPPPGPNVGTPLMASADVNPETGSYVILRQHVRSWDNPSFREVDVAEVDAAGHVVAFMHLGTMNSQDLDLAFNPVTQTFLATGLSKFGFDILVSSLQMNGRREVVHPLSHHASVGSWLGASPVRLSSRSSGTGWLATFAIDGVVHVLPISATCTARDPFIAFGGGLCIDGGWLPRSHPGAMHDSRGFDLVAPPSRPIDCQGSDPFSALGGGVCVNGSWVPSSHPLAANARLPPPSAPPAHELECSGEDPFEAFTDLVGRCVQGGWIPMPGVRTDGVVQFVGTAGWVVIAADGRVLVPDQPLALPLRGNGFVVTLTAEILATEPVLHNAFDVRVIRIKQF
jgi:hypothetical protein